MAPKVKPVPVPSAVAEEVCTGYCVKCKMSKNMLQCVKAVAKNGKPMLQGKCEACSTKMTKFTK